MEQAEAEVDDAYMGNVVDADCSSDPGGWDVFPQSPTPDTQPAPGSAAHSDRPRSSAAAPGGEAGRDAAYAAPRSPTEPAWLAETLSGQPAARALVNALGVSFRSAEAQPKAAAAKSLSATTASATGMGAFDAKTSLAMTAPARTGLGGGGGGGRDSRDDSDGSAGGSGNAATGAVKEARVPDAGSGGKALTSSTLSVLEMPALLALGSTLAAQAPLAADIPAIPMSTFDRNKLKYKSHATPSLHARNS